MLSAEDLEIHVFPPTTESVRTPAEREGIFSVAARLATGQGSLLYAPSNMSPDALLDFSTKIQKLGFALEVAALCRLAGRPVDRAAIAGEFLRPLLADHAAGRVVVCSKCGSIEQVLIDEVPSTLHCPSCQSPMVWSLARKRAVEVLGEVVA